MRKFMKNKKGFTLVELIVVVTVLAILAAIAIPVVTNIVSRANASTDAANVSLYQSAIETFAANNGSYPADAAAAKTVITTNTNVSSITAPKQGGHFVYDSSNHKVTVSSTTSSGITGQLD